MLGKVLLAAGISLIVCNSAAFAKNDLSNALYRTSDYVEFQVEHAQSSQAEKDPNLTYSFVGEEEEGAFQLYVRHRNFKYNDTALAHELNAIEPTAGIQYHLDF